MSQVMMAATDQLHLSWIKSDSMKPGERFEVSEATAAELEKRGLASRVKADAAPSNKMEAAPSNKSKRGAK